MGLVLALLNIAAGYLESIHNKTANTIGADVAAIDKATQAILQENARIKGATVDWSDPSQVAAFAQTLPTFTPIPEP